jgi:hypothetical protein
VWATRRTSGTLHLASVEDWQTAEWDDDHYDRWEVEDVILTECIRLDRGKLASKEGVWHHGERERFYADLASLQEHINQNLSRHKDQQGHCPAVLVEPLAVLGLEWPTDIKTVKAAYRQLSKACHPDRNVGDQDAETQFKIVQKAYKTAAGYFTKTRGDK